MIRVIKTILFCVVGVSAVACQEEKIPWISVPTEQKREIAKPALDQIDFSNVPVLSPKGRFQDGDTALGEPNDIAAEILANGKDSIPFLIRMLEDETEMDHKKVNYWYSLYVGDMALIILTDLFTDKSELHSTIPGFSWDEFLERGDDRKVMGEEVLRRYIRKHGRKNIRQRWQRMWEENKDKIYWDDDCYCFELRR